MCGCGDLEVHGEIGGCLVECCREQGLEAESKLVVVMLSLCVACYYVVVCVIVMLVCLCAYVVVPLLVWLLLS